LNSLSGILERSGGADFVLSLAFFQFLFFAPDDTFRAFSITRATFARAFSLRESCHEFIQRYQRRDHDKTALPMLTSACPGEY